MAAADLTTLADVKAWLTIATGDTTFDTMLTRLITACSGFMQAYMNRNIPSASYTKTFNGTDKAERMMENYPITAVSAVTVNGVAVPAAAPVTNGGVVPSGYYFDDDTVYLYGWQFCRGIQNCQVQYTAGLLSTDPDFMALAQGCIETVGLRFKERQRIGEKNKVVAQENIGFLIADFTPDVVTLMNNLRNVVPAR